MDKYIATQKLYGFKKYFPDFCNLVDKEVLPKILMLTGKKGQGKSTCIHHLLAYYFDKDNYNIDDKIIKENNKFLYDFKSNTNPDVFYYPCDLNIKIDEIRELRKNLQKSSLNNGNRFIIFDDIEHLNHNCINALLKTIEEPSRINHFILINNESKELLETLKSRTIEVKIFQNRIERSDIIKKLILDFEIESKLELDDYTLTPGKFIKFNSIINEEKIDLNANLLVNLQKLFKLHKTKKRQDYLDFSIYMVNKYYFNKSVNINLIEDCNNKRSYITKKIYDYDKLNLNQASLLSELENYF